MRRWTNPDSDTVAQVAALRAAALLDTNACSLLAQPVEHFLHSEDAHVRAAACRVAATMPQQAALAAALTTALDDPVISVRAEAALALHALGRRLPEQDSEAGIALAEALWQCVVAQVGVLNDSTGWYRRQASRRLRRWVRHLATMIPLGHAQISALLDFMPPRISLLFIVYHGDPAYLAYAKARMSDPDTARLAGWTWQTMTGVDLDSSGLTMPEPAPSNERTRLSEARLDADQGLPLPDIEAIAHYSTLTLDAGQRCLAGQVLTPHFACAVLESAPQAQRGIASHFLRQCYPHIKLAPRGPMADQFMAIKRLRTSIEQEEKQ